jgi:CRISPR-associated Csx10 family RAMP protein
MSLNRPEFADFFLKDRIRFGNLYPANFEKGGVLIQELTSHNLPVRPIPKTALSCKRFKGFRLDEETGDTLPHRVYDNLVAWGLFVLSNHTNPEVLEPFRNCSFQVNGEGRLCEEAMDAISGFYRWGAEIPDISRSSPQKRLLTRTGISRQTGTVAQGILYNREVLEEGQDFWGILQIEEALLESFQDFIEKVCGRGLLRVGNNRTRGMGKITITEELMEIESDGREQMVKRIEHFDRKLKEQAQSAGISIEPDPIFFPITLQSKVLLTDPLFRSRTTLDGTYFAQEWNTPGVKLIYQSAGTRAFITWSGIWGIPRPEEVAISMGSVFLLEYWGPEREKLYNTLFRMQEEGIGSRRCEGMGRITVADPFHQEVKGL